MTALDSILAYRPIDRIRRNHGLEHATIHVLTGRRRRTIVGRSDTKGFVLLGDLDGEEIADAAHEALRRMQGGEADLAVHPNCGTNFVIAAAFAGAAAFVALLGARSLRAKLERLPLVFAIVTAALIASQPVGLAIQANITTSWETGGLEILAVRKIADSPFTMHRVETRG